MIEKQTLVVPGLLVVNCFHSIDLIDTTRAFLATSIDPKHSVYFFWIKSINKIFTELAIMRCFLERAG